jgi:hypothetical protein
MSGMCQKRVKENSRTSETHPQIRRREAHLQTSRLSRSNVYAQIAHQALGPAGGRRRESVRLERSRYGSCRPGSAVEAAMILCTVPIAFVGGILALLMARETWNVSSLVGLIGLFGIAVQNSLVLVTQTRSLFAEGRTLNAAVREASIGRVRPKLMTAGTATLGLLPLLILRLHGTEIERPLAVVMIGGLVTSTLFTLLVLPTFYLQVHGWLERRARANGELA